MWGTDREITVQPVYENVDTSAADELLLASHQANLACHAANLAEVKPAILAMLTVIKHAASDLPESLPPASLGNLFHIACREDMGHEGVDIIEAALGAIRNLIVKDPDLLTHVPYSRKAMESIANGHGSGKFPSIAALAKDIRDEWKAAELAVGPTWLAEAHRALSRSKQANARKLTAGQKLAPTGRGPGKYSGPRSTQDLGSRTPKMN